MPAWPESVRVQLTASNGAMHHVFRAGAEAHNVSDSEQGALRHQAALWTFPQTLQRVPTGVNAGQA